MKATRTEIITEIRDLWEALDVPYRDDSCLPLLRDNDLIYIRDCLLSDYRDIQAKAKKIIDSFSPKAVHTPVVTSVASDVWWSNVNPATLEGGTWSHDEADNLTYRYYDRLESLQYTLTFIKNGMVLVETLGHPDV